MADYSEQQTSQNHFFEYRDHEGKTWLNRFIGFILFSIITIAAIFMLLPTRFITKVSRNIAAPPPAVYDYIRNPTTWPNMLCWHHGSAQEIYQKPSSLNQSKHTQSFFWQTKLATVSELEIIQTFSNKVLLYRIEFHQVNVDGRGYITIYQQENGQTKVELTHITDLGWHLLGRVLIPLFRHWTTLHITHVLADLATRLEKPQTSEETAHCDHPPIEKIAPPPAL